MPRFSVIVPAYKVQAYLYEALHSVLRQSFTDLELIAVDDCSPDASGEVIDELAAEDPRVRAVHLTENVGLGRARNAGMEHATGDYLIFLDGDDTLTPGALEAAADRLKETGSPDVLVYDYARTFWTGQELRNQQAAQLREDGPVPFRLTERPGLLKLLMVVWNKAYSREFIEREGFRFPPGYYEDTPFTYPVLMAAETIATLDRVCVHYRQRRQGNILGTTSRKHFDIFDQYDRVFAQFDARPEFAEWRPVVFRRMVDHYATVFSRPDRLPRRSRPEFLRRARAQYRRHHVPGLRLHPRARLQHCLVRLAAHRTYRALRLAKAAGHRLRATAATVSRGTRAALLRLHYRTQLCLPVRHDRAVFATHRRLGHGGNPGAVEEKVRELAPHIRTAWIADPAHHHTVPTATRRITPGTAAYWTALARSKYLVHDADLGHRLVKRRAQVRVQTHAGTPLKRMGLDLQDRPAAARDTDFAALLDDVDTWDYALSANRHSTLVRERVLPGSYTTLEYGQPRNDRFLQASSQDVARLRETLGIPRGNVAILYAPTFRDHRRSQHRPLDLDRVLRVLGPRFTVLTRAHPAYGEPLSRGEHARVVDVSDHPSVESLCLASDVLVTDYSSLMFDYANLDRPIVVFADDQEVYEAARGTYFDLRSRPPGAVARDEDELIDIFTTGHWRGSRSAQLRAAFRARFCGSDDGRAAERVVRHVFLGQRAGLPSVVPLADRRPAPVGGSCFEQLPEQSQGPAPTLTPTTEDSHN
ncbi:bifunctional glycosyltransferase/CDP-glycerol:glycerophosphate glycerophosphotransferase [Streptomyces cavernicola]|uniref:Bifunctional glycosyltransferase family 2 protein/CDP-glycerol:glycerophosphate glycerophosphotransferase n=1 Tax=Streptomyces cavernicola TaxID=3043613 RepID=A0ABT6SL26_9ACTN|nr:bifunctional glycosyltransferase family 2 protein/CDP-glycerol:glycerophosphate glycerophosphotransferase [Streptomyces sp. B-S-A6]MDI3408888.1 bifunctional glycosyltransferase family 2 protein/CDP-glycerol:glycerophosphate glycerophosphotransferase [Streptomyces sp. B-S-A6]